MQSTVQKNFKVFYHELKINFLCVWFMSKWLLAPAHLTCGATRGARVVRSRSASGPPGTRSMVQRGGRGEGSLYTEEGGAVSITPITPYY